MEMYKKKNIYDTLEKAVSFTYPNISKYYTYCLRIFYGLFFIYFVFKKIQNCI